MFSSPRPSLLVQRFAGLSAEPVLAEAGKAGMEEAAKGAGLLVVGLSERWRQEGLGQTRAGDRTFGPGPDRVRAPRHATRCARAAHRHDPVRLVLPRAQRALGHSRRPSPGPRVRRA